MTPSGELQVFFVFVELAHFQQDLFYLSDTYVAYVAQSGF